MSKASRRLAAIMFTDIVGYTAIMSRDVEEGLELLRKNREIHLPLIEKYNGKFLKEMGDGILARFNSSIDSVLCAREIQKLAGEQINAKIRIGIHLGDVTVENKDIYGDGVNIASRIQSIADPGGIYISESVYEAVRARSDIRCELIGEVQLKNVDHLVKTYYIDDDFLPVPDAAKIQQLTEDSGQKKKQKLWYLLVVILLLFISIAVYRSFYQEQNKKIRSLAVLPVENLSGNESEEWLMAGIHHGLIDELGKIQILRVISRTSTLKYAKAGKSVPEIANELDVDGVIEASFSKNGDNLNLQVRLIKAHPEEKLIWRNGYERLMENILTTYGEVALQIAKEIDVNLSVEETQRLTSSYPVNPDAYEAYVKGLMHTYKLDMKNLNAAIRYFDIAVELEPDYAPAYYGKSMYWGALLQSGYIPYDSAKPYVELNINKAFALDSNFVEAHYWMAISNTWSFWNWEKAGQEFKKTLELYPKHAKAHAYYAHYMAYMGEAKEALFYAEKAVELEKADVLILGLYGMSLRHAKEFDKALEILENTYHQYPDEMIIFSTLRSVYHDKKMYKEAIDAGILYYEIKDDTASINALRNGYREGGYEEALKQNAEVLVERSKIKYVTPWQIATLYTRAGMKEEALDWLGKAYDAHDNNMPYINADPIFDFIRDDPRFHSIQDKMNLPN